jgi:hypothetical protein
MEKRSSPLLETLDNEDDLIIGMPEYYRLMMRPDSIINKILALLRVVDNLFKNVAIRQGNSLEISVVQSENSWNQ